MPLEESMIASDPAEGRVTLSSDDVYKMVYKDRSNIKTIHFHFAYRIEPGKYDHLEEDKRPAAIAREKLQKAIERSKKYCENCRYRFIHCELFLIDLAQAEKAAAEAY